MVNKNYKKGANYERKIVNEARRKGFLAFRSAGSHSPVDVVVVNHKTGSLRLIQCKTGEMWKPEINKILKENKHLNGWYKVVFQIRNGSEIDK